MATARRDVEHALAELLALIRRPHSEGPLGVSGVVPEDLQSENFRGLALLEDETRVLEEARSLLSADLRFEYLTDRQIKDITWRLVCRAHLKRQGDLVAEFVAEHARDPMERTCYFPVELLTAKKEVELYGVTIIPADAVERPPALLAPDPGPLPGSVIAVPSRGTNYRNMGTRARPVAERALRLLRATLREERWLPGFQLRFRLGELVWFDDSIRAGWSRRPDEGSELELDEGLLRHATSQEISTLPNPPTNDVERRADLALQWFERAQLAVDPIIELLYLFFALEAILGDKSEGLKAPALAVRRAMLGLLTSGGFTHPGRTYTLYAKVRSAAVHGEAVPEVGQRDVDSFAWDVRRALNEFLQYSRTKGLTKRAQVREALDNDERRDNVVENLVLRDDPKLWSRFLGRPQRD